jgi:hypothetical protein
LKFRDSLRIIKVALDIDVTDHKTIGRQMNRIGLWMRIAGCVARGVGIAFMGTGPLIVAFSTEPIALGGAAACFLLGLCKVIFSIFFLGVSAKAKRYIKIPTIKSLIAVHTRFKNLYAGLIIAGSIFGLLIVSLVVVTAVSVALGY